VADQLNAISGSITIRRTDVSSEELLEAINVADFAPLPANFNTLTPQVQAPTLDTRNSYRAWLTGLFSVGTVRLLNDDGTDTQIVTNLKAIFPTNTTTYTRLVALASRNGSRAEQLFGRNVRVTSDDIAAAVALP
jgi:hypothetical protein